MHSAAETDGEDGSAHEQLGSNRTPCSAEQSAAGAAGTPSEAATASEGRQSQQEQDMHEGFERLPDLGGAAATTDGRAAMGPWVVTAEHYDPR